MLEQIEKLKDLEKAYQAQYNWTYTEKLTAQEYKAQSGIYFNWTLTEIIEEINKTIREL